MYDSENFEEKYYKLLTEFGNLHAAYAIAKGLNIFTYITDLNILEGAEACFKHFHKALRKLRISNVVFITWDTPPILSETKPILISSTIPTEIIGQVNININDITIYSGNVFKLNNANLKVVPYLFENKLTTLMVHPILDDATETMLHVLFRLISSCSTEMLVLKNKLSDTQISLFTDGLMGIPSNKQLINDKTTYNPLHICYIDVDKFKHINDTYGHACGDLVLNGYGEILKTLSNRNVTPYRCGGDEVVILSNDKDKLMYMLNELIKIIKDKTFIFNSNEIRITLSIGVSCFCPNYQLGVVHADELIYRAKNSGRDCIIVENYGGAQTHD